MLDPKSPNVLAGGKRPFHTIIPAFMEKGDQHIGFGIMGGSVQPLAHAQFVSNMVDYGMNLQEAMEAPRFSKNNAPGADRPGPRPACPGRFLERDGRRPGSGPRHRHGRELGRIGPA